jgi:PAP2 superfamily protein
MLGLLAVGACQAPPAPMRPWTQDAASIPATLGHDFVSVYTQPQNWAWLGLGTGLTLLAETETVEDIVSDYVVSNTILSHGPDELLAATGEGTWLFLAAGAAYVGAQLTDQAELYDNSKRTMRSLSVTGLSTLALKFAISDPRPDTGSTNGFPSGHAAMSMSFATAIFESYGWKAGVPAVLVSAAVGLQRIDSQRHALDDVVFGWTLGYMVTHSIFQDRPPEVLGMTITPIIEPAMGGFGIGLSKTF